MFGGMRVWYNPAGIANVISLKTVKSMSRVTDDSEDGGGVFTVHTNKGKMEVILHPKGLHYLDLYQYDTVDLMIAMTVQDNYEGYTKYEVKKATEARKTHRKGALKEWCIKI